MTVKMKDSILMLGIFIAACNGGGGSGSSTPTPPPPVGPGVTYSLTISPNPVSLTYTQESTTLNLGVESFINDENVVVSITNSDEKVVNLNTTSCVLSKKNPNCPITLQNSFNPNGGSATITANAPSYKPANVSLTITNIPNLFTWMNGESTVNQNAQYGTKGVANLNNNPGARNGAISWSDASGNLWLFGGNGVDRAHLNDLWKYNTSNNEWTWVSGENFTNQAGKYGIKGQPNPNNEPGARAFSVAWSDEAGNLWLFGGRGVSGLGNGGALNDLWKYDPSSNEWTWISGESTTAARATFGTKGIPSSNNTPGAKYYASAWRDSVGNFWLFGGFDYNGSERNDLWRYSPKTNEWTWVNGESTAGAPAIYGTKGVSAPENNPGARAAATEWSESGDLWLLGGKLNIQDKNDLWKYDTTTNEWTWISGSNLFSQAGKYGVKGQPDPNNILGARSNSIAWNIKNSNNVWIFGGTGYDQNHAFGALNDLWEYNPTTNEWTWINGYSIIGQNGIYGTIGTPSANNVPNARSIAVNWNDSSGNLWLFGGFNYVPPSSKFNDLWKFTPHKP